MSRCPHRAELALLVDGELTENRGRAVRGHLDRCARCRDEARAFERLVEDLSGAATEGIDLGALEASILEGLGRPVDAPSAPRRSRRFLVGLSAAAAAAVAVVGLLVLLSASGDPGREGRVAAPVSVRQPDPTPPPLMQSRADSLPPPLVGVRKARPFNAQVQEALFEQTRSEPAAECVCRYPAVFTQSL